MWIDATVAAGFVTDPKQSKVADKVGFALAPNNGLGKSSNWLWAWSLAVPAGTSKTEAAEKFVSWATSKHYGDLVAAKEGWAHVPPGTRTSLYKNADYLKAAPWAEMTLGSIDSAIHCIRRLSRFRTPACSSSRSPNSRGWRLTRARTSRPLSPEQ